MVNAAPPPSESDVPEDRERSPPARSCRTTCSGRPGTRYSSGPAPRRWGMASPTHQPVGAWILEKFKSWTDCDGDPVAAFGADRLLDNITVYWLTATAPPPPGCTGRVRPPRSEASSRYPWEGPSSPRRSPCRRARGRTRLHRPAVLNEVEHGGHFAAFEQPRSSFRSCATRFVSCAERHCASAHRHTAVDADHLTGDPRAIIREQEHDHGGNVVGTTEPRRARLIEEGLQRSLVEATAARSVRTSPGATAFARIPCLPQRDATCRTIACIPAFDIA